MKKACIGKSTLQAFKIILSVIIYVAPRSHLEQPLAKPQDEEH
jgi:hypothetical protein